MNGVATSTLMSKITNFMTSYLRILKLIKSIKSARCSTSSTVEFVVLTAPGNSRHKSNTEEYISLLESDSYLIPK